jgi:hypothetical protein
MPPASSRAAHVAGGLYGHPFANALIHNLGLKQIGASPPVIRKAATIGKSDLRRGERSLRAEP